MTRAGAVLGESSGAGLRVAVKLGAGLGHGEGHPFQEARRAVEGHP